MKKNSLTENSLILVISILLSSNVLAQVGNLFDTTNVWRYKGQFFDGINPYPADTFDVSIVGVERVGRITYYKFFPILGIYEYIRADTTGFYCYIPEAGKEYSLYPYDLEVVGVTPSYYATHITVGPPFYIGGLWDTNKVYHEVQWNGSRFGVEGMFNQYYHWGGLIDANHYTIVVNNNFGIIYHSYGDILGSYNTVLIGCRISGVNYGTLVDVKDESPEVMEYTLSQNYPNPFNPVTTIKFSIKEDGVVSLLLYDLLGNVVKTLVNNKMSAGEYSLQLDAADLSSGVYLYRLKVNNFIHSKKLILVK